MSLHESGKGSCKCVAFSVDGTKIYTGGSHGDLCAVDAERACTFSTLDGNNNNPLWRIHGDENIRQDIVAQDDTTNKHNALVIVYPFRKDGEGASMLATGDDNGSVRIFDERLCGGSTQNSTKRPKGCVLEWNQHTDYVSGIEYSPYGTGNNTLLATSADGTLGVYDLRMNKGSVVDTSRTSDHQDDELLSLCILKSGKKVVCGTQTGSLSVFSWGTWGDISDRFPGHPTSVDALLKIDESTVLTGSSDGLIRVVQIHPDKFLGILNESADDRADFGLDLGSASNDQGHSYNHGHGGYPIEKLEYNSNKEIIGSVSHDNYIRLWDAQILKDDNDNSESDDDEEEEDTKPPATSGVTKLLTETSSTNNDTHNSDDEWEDMDNNDDSESDSDDSSSEPDTVNDRRKKRLKTENEKFFDDL